MSGGILSLLVILALLAGCIPPGVVDHTLETEVSSIEASRVALDELVALCVAGGCPVRLEPGTAIDTVEADPTARHVDVRFNEALAHIPFRPRTVDALNRLVGDRITPFFPGHSLWIWSGKHRIDELVPNYFRSASDAIDAHRTAQPLERPAALVRNVDRPWHAPAGLDGRYVALWPSHGWYYDQEQDRWEFQRPRLFQTVEDLLPMAFTHPYIVPMLERAGATVFLPRERDLQVHEVIVDNDGPSAGYLEIGRGWQTGGQPGFAVGEPPYSERVNPFRLGTYRATAASRSAPDTIRWTPDFPESGSYAVHIAYASEGRSITDARYTVYHAGGSTRFEVNQRIGGGTWIYLGTFGFEAGADPERGSVVLTNGSDEEGLVTADAVRFGGGMGNVERGGSTSGRPRWVEAARYYMQYSGMPDSLVYSLSGGANDYTDDFRGRGEWVGYLRGFPFGPNLDREAGLGIPIDLSLAFHTDAGVVHHDRTIGTLMIYSTAGLDGVSYFPDGVSRLANRDFGDILQTQIVDDVRAVYDLSWRRRSLWDRDYAEAVRPNVPAVLLELLSHQNFTDVKFALDPRFRFDASRAIYKGILRFLASHYGKEYVVQPLPVSHFQAVLAGSDGVTLRWRATADPLEPSAEADAYVVYTRVGDGGFDNGVLVDEPEITLAGLSPGTTYSYRVSAVNAGGESFPSETLAVAHAAGAAGRVMIVNGFDRVSGPATVEEGDFEGFADFRDQGVPDRYDLSYTGAQFNFDRTSEWENNDAPGHGASYGDMETLVIPGNTFDFPYVHGQSTLAAGWSFASASGAAVGAGEVDLGEYAVLNLILGEQKTTPWPAPGREPQFNALPDALRAVLTEFCRPGAGIYVSGAHVGTDLFSDRNEGAPGPAFARETLGFEWRTNHAARTGGVFSPAGTFLPESATFAFNTGYHPEIYTVEAPDVIVPAGGHGRTVLRYAENTMSAAVASRGACPTVVFGFPFETILTHEDRDIVMEEVLRFLAGD